MLRLVIEKIIEENPRYNSNKFNEIVTSQQIAVAVHLDKYNLFIIT